MATAVKGLARANQLYEGREQRARELKSQGNHVLGYVCYFVPPEIIEAAGIVPYRITGRFGERITQGDAHVETTMCPYVRNLFDQALKGANGFLDGVVMGHSCDSVFRIYGAWVYHARPPYFRIINTPHSLSDSSREFFKSELLFFAESLEKHFGARVTGSKLTAAIELYNENRALVRDLYEMRRRDPPLVSGSEMLRILVAGSVIPSEEFNSLIKEVREEVRTRRGVVPPRPGRLLFWGSIVDYDDLFRTIEEAGADVVVDDTCIGTRSFWQDVPKSSDPYDGLTQRYFVDFKCPRTIRESDMGRFDYLLEYIADFRVNGVVQYALNFCDPHKFEAPDLRDYLQKKGLPVLYLEDDYTLGNVASMKTRIQAFVEMIS